MHNTRGTTADGELPRRGVLRIGVLSDLHLECDRAQPPVRKLLRGRRRLDPTPVDDDGHPLYGPPLDALRDVDVVLACGDVDVKTWPAPWLDAASRYTGRPWIYIMGNHEYYDRPVENALRDLRAACADTAGRVTLLENERVDLTVCGLSVAVLGCTLWTDYALLGAGRLHEARTSADAGMNDHRYIRRAGGTMRWTPVAAAITHARSRRWLEHELARARKEADAVLVATHHAPSGRSIPDRRRGHLLSAAYASDLEHMMGSDGPDLWAHGHIHRPADYRVGRTRVVAAPRGRIGHEPGAEDRRPRVLEMMVGS